LSAPRPLPLPWSEEIRRKDAPARLRFLESHLDLVRYLALRIAARLPPAVEIEDLVHDGVVGLLDAADRFDPDRGVQFRTYAETRIRGAILDGLRRLDWRPRSLRQMKRTLDAAVAQLASAHRRAASEQEIAEALGLGLDDYREQLAALSRGTQLSLDELLQRTDVPAAAQAEPPHAGFERAELVATLAEEIERLPERERVILGLYYFQELTMKEVGAALGVTESRVCQLHAQAAARLRAALAARLHAAPAGAGRNR
jgi:RNA polymerase sigma factor for flagellar operon FliA